MRYVEINKIFLSFLIIFSLWTLSCSTINNQNASKNYKFIDYIFPSSIDSLIASKLRKLPSEITKNIVVTYKSNGSIPVKIPSRNHSINADYLLQLIYIPDWWKDSKFEYINSETFKYAARRTNRFAVINNGEFILPVIIFDDIFMMGRGYPQKPPSNMMGWPEILSIWVYSTYKYQIRFESGERSVTKWRRSFLNDKGEIMDNVNAIVE